MRALCLDAGTSLVKAVVFDDDGEAVATAHRPTGVARPQPGFAEQDMVEVWEAAAATMRDAAQAAGGGIEVIAVTAQGDGCWLVDAAGRPVGPAPLWCDGRSADAVRRWMDDGTVERAFAITGSTTFAGLPNAILSWLREQRPADLERAAAALTCGGWLLHQLTGEVAMDISDASAPWLDARTMRYAPQVLELFDLPWAQRLLPAVRTCADSVAELTPSAAAAIGVAAGTPVVMAPYDIAATAIGSGATAPGAACSILGTTLCTEVLVDTVDTSGPPSGFTIALGVGELRLRAHPTLAGTEILHWAARLLNADGPERIPELAARARPGAGGVVMLPYFSPAGERAPFLAPDARGTLHGMTVEHGPEHLARAVLESLSHVVRDCLEAAPARPAELALCGGGAASDVWCQLIADVTGVPVTRAADREVGAKGAMVMAALATGAQPSLPEAAARLVRPGQPFAPAAELRDFYDDQHVRFLEIRAANAPAWQRLAAA